jgi:hypothetical protein
MAVDAGWCGALWKRGSTGGLRRLPRRTAMPARYVGQDEQVREGNKCLRSTKLHEERLNVETEFSRQRRARVPLAKTPVGGPGRDEGKEERLWPWRPQTGHKYKGKHRRASPFPPETTPPHCNAFRATRLAVRNVAKSEKASTAPRPFVLSTTMLFSGANYSLTTGYLGRGGRPL